MLKLQRILALHFGQGMPPLWGFDDLIKLWFAICIFGYFVLLRCFYWYLLLLGSCWYDCIHSEKKDMDASRHCMYTSWTLAYMSNHAELTNHAKLANGNAHGCIQNMTRMQTMWWFLHIVSKYGYDLDQNIMDKMKGKIMTSINLLIKTEGHIKLEPIPEARL